MRVPPKDLGAVSRCSQRAPARWRNRIMISGVPAICHAQTAPLRDQVNSQAIGGTLPAPVPGRVRCRGGRRPRRRHRAASGAIVGTGIGAANAQNAAGYLQQQYNAYYDNPWRRGISTTAIWRTCSSLRAGSGLFSDAKLRTAARLFEQHNQQRLEPQG